VQRPRVTAEASKKLADTLDTGAEPEEIVGAAAQVMAAALAAADRGARLTRKDGRAIAAAMATIVKNTNEDTEEGLAQQSAALDGRPVIEEEDRKFARRYADRPKRHAVRTRSVVVRRPLLAAKVARARAPRRRHTVKVARAGDADVDPPAPVGGDAGPYDYDAPPPDEAAPQRNERQEREWDALNKWKRGLRDQRNDPRSDLSAQWLLKDEQKKKTYYLSLTALEDAPFRCRAAKAVAYVIIQCLWRGRRALIASAEELAALAHTTRRTVFRALAELRRGGWVHELPRYRPGKDGHRYWRTANAYEPGQALQKAWFASHRLAEVPCHGGTAATNTSTTLGEGNRVEGLGRDSQVRANFSRPNGTPGATPREAGPAPESAGPLSAYLDRLRRDSPGLTDEQRLGLVARRAVRQQAEAQRVADELDAVAEERAARRLHCLSGGAS
jgi:hypothetical protein